LSAAQFGYVRGAGSRGGGASRVTGREGDTADAVLVPALRTTRTVLVASDELSMHRLFDSAEVRSRMPPTTLHSGQMAGSRRRPSRPPRPGRCVAAPVAEAATMVRTGAGVDQG
jgi:hypothetical protein